LADHKILVRPKSKNEEMALPKKIAEGVMPRMRLERSPHGKAKSR
jgi:hypothetical protein